MEQVFRIEIPVEVKSNADLGQMKQIEAVLKAAEQEARKLASSANSAFNNISSGASSAASSMQQIENAAQQSANSMEQIGDSADEVGDAADDAADSMEEIGDAAREAGNAAESSMNEAAGSADKFSQRMEKTGKSLRDAFKEKIKLIMEVADKISPVVKDITTKLKSLAAKAWKVTVTLFDLVTAPFKALKSMIMNPITMTLSIAGIGLGASSFYQTFTEFESGMSNVKALSGATNEEFARLKETASELGATTKFTAAEAAEGMQYLAMAGWKTNQIIDAMPGLLELAAAGGTDLGTAADIVSDVMTAMGMSADQASRAADIFARTATSTNTTVAMMGETMKYAAPVAKAFGLELAEVATITGMMANAGIKGGSAGTAIRTALMRLASPSKEAAKAMQQLGFSITDSAGNMKDMQTIIGELSAAFAGLSEDQRLALADDLFGKNAASAWLAVLDQGADAYNELYESISNSAGAAKEMAAIQLDNLAGDVTLLQSAVDGMKVSLMDKINPYLRQGVQWLTSKIPELTAAIGNLVDKGIEKATELKNRITEVFNSSEFQNADSLADKFFIAWDKIVAEPFSEWWNGSGRGFILGLMQKIGSTFGEVLHGIITGIFAAIKGEEIDFEGLNITGIAKAGAEAAKEYVSSFMQGLNVGDMMGKMPGWMNAGLLGYGVLKVGSGALGIARTIGTLRLAFGGVSTAAATAATATAATGEAAAAAAAGAASGASAFAGLGSALAAIPGWGWAALAALTAVGIGIKLYNDEQRRQSEAFSNAIKEANEAASEYTKAGQKAQTIHSTFEEVKVIKAKIEEGGKNEETVEKVKQEIQGIEDRTVYLSAQLASDTLSPSKRQEYQDELDKLKGREVELKARLESGECTPTQIQAYQTELDKLHGREVELKAALKKDELTPSDIEAYQQELDKLHGNDVELTAKLNAEGYNVVEAAVIIAQMHQLQGKEAEAAVMIANKSDMTPEQITAYVTELSKIATAKAELEVKKSGAGMTPEEIQSYTDKLAGIQNRKAEIEILLTEGEGSMKKGEWDALVSEYSNLTSQEKAIKLKIDGSELDDTEVKNLDAEIQQLQERASNILLQISEKSDMSQEDLENLAGTFRDIGDIKMMLNFSLSSGSLTQDDLEQYNEQLKELYSNIQQLTGGAFSLEDLESGAVTQEQAEEYALADAAAKAEEVGLAVDRAKANLPRAQQERDNAEQKYKDKEQDVQQAREARAEMQTMQRDLDRLQTQDQRKYEAAQRSGDMSEYDQWRESTYDPAIKGMQEKYAEDIAPKLQTSEGYNMAQTEMGYRDLDELGSLPTAIEDLDNYIADETKKRDEYKSDYEAKNQEMRDLYGNEKALVEAEAFGNNAATAGKSLEEMAAQYNQLDEAGKQAFADAMQGLEELNQQADYISDAEKTTTADIAQTAVESVETQAKTDVLDGMTDKLSTMADTYSKLSDAGKEAWDTGNLEQLNSELAALNLEPLESLEGVDLASLQGMLQALGSDIDPTSLNGMGEAIQAVIDQISGLNTDSIKDLDFSTLTSALEGMGGNADAAKEAVTNVKTAMEELGALTVDSASSSVESLGSAATDTATDVDTAKSAVDALNGATADSAASSVSSVGSAASGAADKVDDVKSAMEKLDGTTATVTINVKQNGSIPDGAKVDKNAEGGIYDGAFLSWVAEDGPEAIIPLGGKRRERGLELWEEAGRALGVNEFAEGGILAPYAGVVAKAPDEAWSDDGNGSGDYRPQMPTGNNAGGDGNVVQVSIGVNPQYTIEGGNGDPDAILDVIKSKQAELAELLGAAMADQLEDILTNM